MGETWTSTSLDQYKLFAARSRHCRVQGATGDATNGKSANGHAGANGKAKQMRGLCALRHGHAKHHEAKNEGIDNLGHRNASPGAETHRAQCKRGALVDEGVCQSCGNATGNLNAGIHASLGRSEVRAAARRQDGHCDSRVEVGTRNIAKGIDHGGEASSNGECSSLGLAQHIQTNGEDQHVSSQEFAHQLRDLGLLAAEIFWTHNLQGSRKGPIAYHTSEQQKV